MKPPTESELNEAINVLERAKLFLKEKPRRVKPIPKWEKKFYQDNKVRTDK